jgi:hypothetical protein
MITDREQHELAAKAAGIVITFRPDGICRDVTGFHPMQNVLAAKTWWPKEDDGDAFRLGVMLNLFTSPRFSHFLALERFGRQDLDDATVTRLAIFRAAVEIGKAMP